MSRICTACTAVLVDGNRFCENCGTGVASACRACGGACGPAARFCGSCGAPQATAAAAPAVRPAPTSGWGELKQATILFADIVSSTEQIAALDPEQAMERLQPGVRRMCAVIERSGGTVTRTLGDGVMALFGVPKALENHALLACEAAIALQEAFDGAASGLSIRVGLHSGLVASDPGSASSGWAQGAHGLAVHIASRVVGLAEPGGICLTEDCQVLLRRRADALPMGRHMLKGIGQPVQIYALKGLAAAGDASRPDAGSLSPFRGRDREMAVLRDALQRARDGQACVVGISGAPGTGKSRLAAEFTQLCGEAGVPVHEVRTQLYGDATPLQPALALLRDWLFGIPAGAEAEIARERIAALLAAHPSRTAADAALLNDFLGVGQPGDEALPAADPKARHARLLALVGELSRVRAARPAVILIEDVHWIDEASEEFVGAIAAAVAGTHALLVLNYRPVLRARWESGAPFVKIELADLGREDIETIVRSMLSQRREFHDICELIAERSAGNPFFAEELVRTLAESGRFNGELSEAGKASVEAMARALPATVHAVIGARIDRLGDAHKSVLQMCAIIGKEISPLVLRHVAGPALGDIDEVIVTLCQLELLHPDTSSGHPCYAFRHPLIQEVAYGMQLKARRAMTHAAVAEAMKLQHGEDDTEFSGLIGHHFEAAGRSLDAAAYMAKAARWVGFTNTATAVRHWRRIVTVLETDGSDEGSRLKALAAAQVALLGWREGMTLQEVRPYLDDAKALASRLDSRLAQLVLLVEGRMLQAGGMSADESVEPIRTALGLVPRGEDPGRDAMLNAVLCQAYGRAGLVRQAMDANDAALKDMARIDRFDREFVGFSMEQWILSMRGRLLARLGKAAEARRCWALIIEADPAPVDPTVEVIGCLGNIELAWCTRDAALAAAQEERLAALVAKYRVPYVKAVAQLCCGIAAITAGETSRARPELSDALALVRSGSVAIEFEPEMLSGLAECHLADGEYQQARDLALESVALSVRRAARVSECRGALVFIAAAVERPDAGSLTQARRLLLRAEELLGVTGADIYKARLEEARAALHAAEPGPAAVRLSISPAA